MSLSGTPYFVDQANGDYHLDAFVQTALDFAPALGDVDLDSLAAAVDLPSVQNQFGARAIWVRTNARTCLQLWHQ